MQTLVKTVKEIIKGGRHPEANSPGSPPQTVLCRDTTIDGDRVPEPPAVFLEPVGNIFFGTVSNMGRRFLRTGLESLQDQDLTIGGSYPAHLANSRTQVIGVDDVDQDRHREENIEGIGMIRKPGPVKPADMNIFCSGSPQLLFRLRQHL